MKKSKGSSSNMHVERETKKNGEEFRVVWLLGSQPFRRYIIASPILNFYFQFQNGIFSIFGDDTTHLSKF